MVTGSVTAVEIGDTEGRITGREISRKLGLHLLQVGRVKTKSQSMFLRYKEVTLQSIANQKESGRKDSSPEVIKMTMPGIIAGNHFLNLLLQALTLFIPFLQLRHKPSPKKTYQSQRNLRAHMKSPPNLTQIINVRLTVSQVGMTKSDHGINQQELFAIGQIAQYILAIKAAFIGQNLGIVKLPLETLIEIRSHLATFLEIESSEKMRIDTGCDLKTIGPADPPFKTVKNLKHLFKKTLAGRITD